MTLSQSHSQPCYSTNTFILDNFSPIPSNTKVAYAGPRMAKGPSPARNLRDCLVFFFLSYFSILF